MSKFYFYQESVHDSGINNQTKKSNRIQISYPEDLDQETNSGSQSPR